MFIDSFCSDNSPIFCLLTDEELNLISIMLYYMVNLLQDKVNNAQIQSGQKTASHYWHWI